MADPPANRKIRVTLFWADEDACVQDFRAGNSKRMVEWANEFFQQYLFELDVQPDPAGKIADAYPYCLVKSGGYEPDFASHEDTTNRMVNERLPVYGKWLQTGNQQIALLQKQSTKIQEVEAARVARDALPANHPDRSAAQAALDARTAELVQLDREYAVLEAEYQRLWKEMDVIENKFVAELEERNFQNTTRLQLGRKILAAFPLRGITGIKSPSENPHIYSPRRLKIVLARFRQSPRVMQMRLGNQPFGVTLGASSFNRLNGQYLFEGPYITIDVLDFEQITLAHEIVHAAGRRHRSAQVRFAPAATWIKRLTMDPSGKVSLPNIYEYEENPEHNDGPKNDIINYQSKGMKAKDVILQPSDATLLADSDFVKDLPPPFDPNAPFVITFPK